MSKGGHHWFYVWSDFCRFWRKLGVAMKDPEDFRRRLEMRERHLADGQSVRSWFDSTTVIDLTRYAMWELNEAQDSLNPSAALRGEPENTFHAGCCIMRATCAIARIRRDFGGAVPR